jgi:lipoprotein-releasing system permease protein
VYQALLTRRYLTSKIMPMLAVVSVMLSSALVLVAWSIMGGFLTMLLEVGRKMEGDVTVSWPTAGFAYYDELIQRLEQDELVAGAAPMIETFGMVTLPDDRAIGMRIKGIDGRFAKVSDFENQVWWRPITTPEPRDRDGRDPRLPAGDGGDGGVLQPRIETQLLEQLYQQGLSLSRPDPATGRPKPGVVPGIEAMGFSVRQPGGYYMPAYAVSKRTADGRFKDIPGFAPLHNITVRVIPMDRAGRDMSLFVSRTLPVVNEYRTGLFEADKNTVLMDLGELQRMLGMHEQQRLSDAAPDPYAVSGEGAGERLGERAVIGIEPARVTTVLVKARDGIDAETLRRRVVAIYAEFASAHDGKVPDALTAEQRMISTWERSLSTFIGAVKKETAMVVGMLLFMSLVCAVLILCIFWAMVSEKTKDIGILRAVGAGRGGVAWLWLRYGLVIGVVGAGLGLSLGSMIVWNINPIHEWLGERMGISIWDPSVYYFPTIPSIVETQKAVLVAVSAVVCAVLGALVPALKAAFMDPVRALRFE